MKCLECTAIVCFKVDKVTYKHANSGFKFKSNSLVYYKIIDSNDDNVLIKYTVVIVYDGLCLVRARLFRSFLK